MVDEQDHERAEVEVSDEAPSAEVGDEAPSAEVGDEAPSAEDVAMAAMNDAAEAASPVLIVADSREPRELLEAIADRGVPVERRQISPADFVVGPIAIERKNIQDFYGSLLRKRLFEQLTRLKATYPPPAVLLLEGDLAWAEELEQPAPFWGALLAASIDLGISVLPSPSLESSADILALLARRIGRTGGRTEIRFKSPAFAEGDEQRFAVQGLPGIGGVMSDALLAHFGSVRRVFAADGEELRKIRGIGPKRAGAIVDLLDRPFTAKRRKKAAAVDAPEDAPEDAIEAGAPVNVGAPVDTIEPSAPANEAAAPPAPPKVA